MRSARGHTANYTQNIDLHARDGDPRLHVVSCNKNNIDSEPTNIKEGSLCLAASIPRYGPSHPPCCHPSFLLGWAEGTSVRSWGSLDRWVDAGAHSMKCHPARPMCSWSRRCLLRWRSTSRCRPGSPRDLRGQRCSSTLQLYAPLTLRFSFARFAWHDMDRSCESQWISTSN